jgi:glucose-1-phosphate thymidylyltransferase
MDKIRGVICAGGQAKRLGVLTAISNKHLLPVDEWPMIFYSLKSLEQTGIKEICLITGKEHGGDFIDRLSNGQVFQRESRESILDLDITYRVQDQAGGIAQAIGLAENFANREPIVVMLGDNIIQGNIIKEFQEFFNDPSQALIMVKRVPNPSDYGVLYLDESGNPLDIIEKPENPEGNLAVIGIYMYPSDVFNKINTLKPSGRGELEVTDLNRAYLQENRLRFRELKGWWRDAGRDPRSLAEIGFLISQTGACDPEF